MAKPIDESTAMRGYASNPADLPRGTLVRLFFDAVDAYGDGEALRYKAAGSWHSISYREVETRVRHLALALRSFGVQRGDRVAILSENRPEWAIADYGALCTGAFDVPVYPNLPPDQVAYILRDAGARLVFCSTAEQLDKVREVAADVPELETSIVFDDVAPRGEGERTFAEALERGRREEASGGPNGFREHAHEAEPDEVATVLYTSGTTGRPKGVMLTHDNIYTNTEAVRDVLPMGPEDVALSLLPLSHIFERMVDYFLFSTGCSIAYAESIETVIDNLPEVRPTLVVTVPRLFEKIYTAVLSAGGAKGRIARWAARIGNRWVDAKLTGHKPPASVRLRHALADRLVFSKLRARIGGRLRLFVSGGAPLDPEIGRFFYSAGMLILEGYGLTETSPVTNVNTPDAFRFGTVGRPVPGTEEAIAMDGEILVRGPQVMKGYYRQPEATREAIDEEGWFHTGDIGDLDADGYLSITDRKKELIVTAGGKNVAPAPIENRVKLNPFVLEAVIVGDRRPFPALLIVPNFEALETWAEREGVSSADRAAMLRDERVVEKMEQEVFGAVAGFARYERPKEIALLEREFTIGQGELTPSLKVRRRAVEDHFRSAIEALYADSTTRGVAAG